MKQIKQGDKELNPYDLSQVAKKHWENKMKQEKRKKKALNEHIELVKRQLGLH